MIKNYEVIHIYQEFYNKLQVKNLRFYERVNKDYNEIVSLVDDLTITSKEHILRNLLIVRYADYFPIKIQCEDESYNFLFDLEFLSKFDYDYSIRGKEKSMVTSALDKFFGRFISFYELDDWIKIISKNIKEHSIDNDIFIKLINDDKVSDKEIQEKIKCSDLIKELYDFNLKQNFLDRFYEMSINMIEKKDFNDLSFLYKVIFIGNKEWSENFKMQVENYIKEMIKNKQRKPSFNTFYPFGVESYDIFADVIRNEIENYQTSFDFCEFFITYDRYAEYDDFVKNKVRNITKDELKQVIWLENENLGSRRDFIKSILGNRYFSDEKREQIRQWIIELLNEKIQENPDSELAVKFWLTHTENLTKF